MPKLLRRAEARRSPLAGAASPCGCPRRWDPPRWRSWDMFSQPNLHLQRISQPQLIRGATWDEHRRSACGIAACFTTCPEYNWLSQMLL
jgi:hypothetical protein